MSPKTFRLKGHFKFIFYDLAVLGKNLLALESFAKEKVKVEFSKVDYFKQTIFPYMSVHIC